MAIANQNGMCARTLAKRELKYKASQPQNSTNSSTPLSAIIQLPKENVNEGRWCNYPQAVCSIRIQIMVLFLLSDIKLSPKHVNP